jgi:hypothetical protein
VEVSEGLVVELVVVDGDVVRGEGWGGGDELVELLAEVDTCEGRR